MPREEATVDARDRRLALDDARRTSSRRGSPPRATAARRVPRQGAEEVPRRRRRVRRRARSSRVPPTPTATLVAATRSRRCAPGEGTALGDAVALAVAARASGSARRDGIVPPTSVLVISDGARDGGRTRAARRRAPARRRAHIPVYTVARRHAGRHRRRASSPAATSEQIRVPPSPATLQQIAQRDRRRVLHARARRAALTRRLREARLAARPQDAEPRDHRRRSPAAAALLLLVGGALSALWFRRRPVRRCARRSPPLVGRARAVAAGAAPRATNECRGPAGLRAGRRAVGRRPGRTRRGSVEFQLACPKGYIVGGPRRELSEPRRSTSAFLGSLGSPVNPGITTSRDAVFLGTYVVRGGAARRRFRPHIGCMPASRRRRGARRPRTTPSRRASRRVAPRDARCACRPGRRSACARLRAASERLVGASHAVGFSRRRAAAPRRSSAPSRRRSASATAACVVVGAGDAAMRRCRAVVQARRSSARRQDELRPPAPAPDAARRSRRRSSLYRLAAAAAHALRGALHEPRRARLGRRGGRAVAPLARRRRLPARARRALRRASRGRTCTDARRERQRDGRSSCSTSPARCRRRTSSRRGSSRRRRRCTRSSTRCRRGCKVGLVALRRRGAGRDAADDRPRARVARRSTRSDFFRGFGGTAIGDALAPPCRSGSARPACRELGDRAPQSRQLAAYVTREAAGEHARLDPLPLGRPPDARHPAPLAGRRKARAAGHPGLHGRARHDRNTTLRGFPGQGFGGRRRLGGGFGFGRRGLAPDPKTLHAIADRTGGKFFRAKSAGAVQDAYATLGSKLGRKPGNDRDHRSRSCSARRRPARARGAALGALVAAAALSSTARTRRG